MTWREKICFGKLYHKKKWKSVS